MYVLYVNVHVVIQTAIAAMTAERGSTRQRHHLSRHTDLDSGDWL